MMLFRPEGLIPSARRKAELEEPERGAPAVRRADMSATEPRPEGEPLLEAIQVRKEFGGLVAVNDVDFTIPRGSIVSLIGPNGAGKTTFFNILTGVYKPTAGGIVFKDVDITGAAAAQGHAARHGADVPEHPPLPQHDAVENVLVAMHTQMKGGVWASIFRTQRQQHEEADAARRRGELLDYAGLRGRTTSTRRTCRTATSAGSRWPARSRPSPSCCCSTSRPRA